MMRMMMMMMIEMMHIIVDMVIERLSAQVQKVKMHKLMKMMMISDSGTITISSIIVIVIVSRSNNNNHHHCLRVDACSAALCWCLKWIRRFSSKMK